MSHLPDVLRGHHYTRRDLDNAADLIEELEATVVPPAIRSVAFMAKTMIEGDRPVGPNVVMTLALWCLGEVQP